MSNCILGYANYADAGGRMRALGAGSPPFPQKLTLSPAYTGPLITGRVENASIPRLDRAFIVPGTGSATITCSISSISNFPVDIIGGSSSTVGSIETARLYAVDGTLLHTTGFFNLSQSAFNNAGGVILPQTFNVGRVELDVQAGTNIGYLYIGPAFRPAINFSFGYRVSYVDLSEKESNPITGAEFVTFRKILKKVAFSLEQILDAEDVILQSMLLNAGQSTPVFFAKDAADLTQDVVIGRLENADAITYPGFDLRTKAFEIKQIG